MKPRTDGLEGLELNGDRDLTIAFVSLHFAIGGAKIAQF